MKVDQHLGVTLCEPNFISNPNGWSFNAGNIPMPTRHKVFDHNLSGIRVISTVEKTSNERGIELHLSISKYGGIYPDKWMEEKVRQDFNAQNFEKDDHGSCVMHLWLPIEKDKRGQCDCKETK